MHAQALSILVPLLLQCWHLSARAWSDDECAPISPANSFFSSRSLVAVYWCMLGVVVEMVVVVVVMMVLELLHFPVLLLCFGFSITHFLSIPPFRARCRSFAAFFSTRRCEREKIHTLCYPLYFVRLSHFFRSIFLHFFRNEITFLAFAVRRRAFNPFSRYAHS